MASLKEVAVPDIGDFTDVPIVELLVSVGDTVALEDPLVALESDKATMEVPAPFAGVVQELKVKLGDTVSEGVPLLVLEVTDTVPKGSDPDGTPSPEPRDEPPSDAASVPKEADPVGTPGAVYASPGVRREARKRGVDLAAVTGTGRKGRITKEDLERPVAAPAQAPAAADDALGLAPWPKVDFAKFGPIERVPLTRINKLAGANLARNWVRIPHVTHHDEADVTDLEAFRKQLNQEQADVKVTMVALLLKACAAVLKEFPKFNASLDGEELVLRRYYHLGFAADTPNGLVVPVIRDVDQKGLYELAGELTELSGLARAGKLSPTQMSGATFTISSLGGIGGTAFTPIINAPEVAILGVVRSQTKPVWDGSAFVPRLLLPLSLSYDHRVIDGAAAARFVAQLGGVLSDLRRVLL